MIARSDNDGNDISRVSAMTSDQLLAAAGLTTDDFYAILAVEETPYSGRISVTTKRTLGDQPVQLRNAENLYLILHEADRQVFVFNRIAP